MEANLNNAFVFSQPIINEKGNDMVNGAIMALVKVMIILHTFNEKAIFISHLQ